MHCLRHTSMCCSKAGLTQSVVVHQPHLSVAALSHCDVAQLNVFCKNKCITIGLQHDIALYSKGSMSIQVTYLAVLYCILYSV